LGQTYPIIFNKLNLRATSLAEKWGMEMHRQKYSRAITRISFILSIIVTTTFLLPNCYKNGGDSTDNHQPPLTPFSIVENPSAGSDIANDIAVDGAYIYLVGWDEALGIGDGQWRIEKRDIITGELVSSFDADGVVQSNPSSIMEEPLSIAVDGQYIYIAGYDRNLINAQWRIEKRDISTGSPVSDFDSDGIALSNPSSSNDIAWAIAVGTQFIYIAGNDEFPGDSQWRVEKRDINTGTLVNSFDGNGVVQSNPSSNFDFVRSIATDSLNVYIAGYNATGNRQWRIEKRDILTGNLETDFDSDGIVDINYSANNDEINSISVDLNYIYVAGYDKVGGNFRWRIEKRNKNTGALITAFDTDGVVVSNPSNGSDKAQDIAVDSHYIYIVGDDYSPVDNSQWRVEKRDKETGALVLAFDNDGVLTFDPSTGDDVAQAIAVDSQYIYITGYDQGPGDPRWRIEKRDKITGGL
jgi:hypothetical protein